MNSLVGRMDAAMLGRFRRRWKSLVTAAGLLAVVALNVVAYRHAWHMTHFSKEGLRTSSPEDLGIGAKLWVLLNGIELPRPRNRRDPAEHGFDFTTHELEARDGTRLEAWHIPAARGDDGASAGDPAQIVLVCHGYGGTKESLFAEAAELHALGLDVLLLDFRGSGGSAGDTTSIGWFEAFDVEAAVHLARETLGAERVALHGVSMGAAAGLRATHELGVRVDAMALEAPFPTLLSTTIRRFERMGLPSWPSAWLLVYWGGAQLDFDAFAFTPEQWIATVPCPTLALFGAEDPNVSAEDVERFLAHAPEDVRSVVVPDAAHAPLVHGRQEWWRETVGEFLASAGFEITAR